MIVVLLSLGLFALAMLLLSVGVLLGGRRLQGSCGGSRKDCVCAKSGSGPEIPAGRIVLGASGSPLVRPLLSRCPRKEQAHHACHIDGS